MPKIEVLCFSDDDGSVPVLDWLDKLTLKIPNNTLLKSEKYVSEKNYSQTTKTYQGCGCDSASPIL